MKFRLIFLQLVLYLFIFGEEFAHLEYIFNYTFLSTTERHIDPTQDDMAASNGYVDSNFVDLAGGTMVGDINMSGNNITNLPDIPPTDNSTTCKKYMNSEVSKISSPSATGPSTLGFSMTGNIDMGQNEVINLPDNPLRNHSAVSNFTIHPVI